MTAPLLEQMNQSFQTYLWILGALPKLIATLTVQQNVLVSNSGTNMSL